MTGKQFEVADILKSLLRSSFRFSGVGFFFFVPFFQTRTANPVIRFLPRTEFTHSQAAEGWGRGGGRVDTQ